MTESDKWWASLTVARKERLARKIVKKDKLKGVKTEYPYCTTLWNSLPEERKQSIRDHCEGEHGYFAQVEQEGSMYSE